jgi:thioredoxin reductase (NADPH)
LARLWRRAAHARKTSALRAVIKRIMTDTPPPSAVPAAVNLRFTPADIEALLPYGEVLRHPAGAVLFTEGDRRVDCHVVIEGQLDVYLHEKGQETRVAWLEPGQFPGDVAILTGQAVWANARMATDGAVLHIPHARFQRLLVENARLSDMFINTMIARRARARDLGRSSITVVGASYDRETLVVRGLLDKHGMPYAWMDVEADPALLDILAAKGIARADLPVVFRGRGERWVRPSLMQLSEALGLDLLPDGACADVIVVGAGPAGLAASVYAASEGLSVLTLDADAPGGQAGSSSKIENYLGFPTGVSGRELAERAAVQAQKFGARIAGPARAASLERIDKGYCLRLADGRSVLGRAVVLATGVEYRRLELENLEHFEGRGVFYGATPMEAQLATGAEVAVVGAGNSAGQGAMYLARTAKTVHVLFRRANIRDTMSEYLVRRLEETPNVVLHPACDIRLLQGCEERLRTIVVRTPEGEETLETPFVFLFIGAAPNTEWLPATLCKDAGGFIHTGAAIGPAQLVRAGWGLERMPSAYETSWPRVYAVGDTRAGSVKRVASAVGEGSVVVQAIHAALGEAP